MKIASLGRYKQQAANESQKGEMDPAYELGCQPRA